MSLSTRVVLIVIIIVILSAGALLLRQERQENTTDTPGDHSMGGTTMEVPAPGTNPDDVQEMVVEEGEGTMVEEGEGEGMMVEEGEGEGMMMEDEGPSSSVVRISYTDAGYVPSTITIQRGDTVQFTNESSRKNWPASIVHPTHTVYPGSGLQKCSGSEASTIFDACAAHDAGQIYEFTFNEVGEWGFHNHVRSPHFGRITVK